MATSDTKSAFRLPWLSGHASETEVEAAVEAGAEPAATGVANPPAWPSHDLVGRQQPNSTGTSNLTGNDQRPRAMPADAPEAEAPMAQEPGMTDAMTAPSRTSGETANPWGPSTSTPSGDARSRKPTKFLADLTRAMRAAADEARQQALAQFQADVTVHIDAAHRESESSAADARNRAEEDVTALREWSKAEIVRIKQETEDGIAKRRVQLDAELADQAAGLELELERVQVRLRGFEAEMDGFFQRLAQEDDPARFAAMAEQLPEPPGFEDWRPELTIALTTPSAPASRKADESPRVDDRADQVPAATGEAPAATAETPDASVAPAEATDAVEAVQAEAQQTPEEITPATTDSFDAADAAASVDWAAAEAEAGDASETTVSESVSDDWHSPRTGAPTTRTQVAVTGLVSVASIATFKRLLSRASGINSVQVASGPEGEFVFSATHDADCDVAAAVRGLQGFEVEVVDAEPGHVNAKAVDPEVS